MPYTYEDWVAVMALRAGVVAVVGKRLALVGGVLVVAAGAVAMVAPRLRTKCSGMMASRPSRMPDA